MRFIDELPHTPRGSHNRGKSKYEELAAACRANPGKWTEFARGPRDQYNALRQRAYQPARKFGWQVANRLIDGEAVVFVRYRNGAES